MATVSDQIRRALLSCGRTPYRVSKDTGISQSVLARFIDEQTGLSMRNLDTLAADLDLELAPRRVTKKGTKR